MFFKERMKNMSQGMKSMLQSRYEEVVPLMSKANGSFRLKMWDAKTGEILVEWDKLNKKRIKSCLM